MLAGFRIFWHQIVDWLRALSRTSHYNGFRLWLYSGRRHELSYALNPSRYAERGRHGVAGDMTASDAAGRQSAPRRQHADAALSGCATNRGSD
jgi:hypothetical protein